MRSDQLIFSSKHCKKLKCIIKFITSQIKLTLTKKTVITETSSLTILKCQKTSVSAVPLPSVKSVKSVKLINNKSISLSPSDIITESLNIALIDVTAFSRLNIRKQHQDDVQLFFMTVQEMEKVLSDDTAEDIILQLSMKEVLSRVLESYQNLKNAFDLIKTQKLPPHHSYNHYIEIDKNKKKLSRSKVYSIFNYKLEKLKEYLNENLKKNFINFSHALYISSVLFAVKANESLRVCVNY